jgi:hypothetical protein
MAMKRFLFVLLGGLTVLALLGKAPGAPWDDARPNGDLYVTPQAGPWLIMAAWYKGEEGKDLAREFALEVKRHYKVNTYVFNHGEKERKEQEAQIQQMKELLKDTPIKRIRRVRVEEQWAVLIGGYKDMESANKALVDLRKKTLSDIQNNRVPPNWTKFCSILWTASAQQDQHGGVREGAGPKGASYDHPLMSAMVVHNPSVAPEVKKDNKPDPFLKELNSGETYSLLKCKKPWTLAVKELRGTSELHLMNENPSVVEKSSMGKHAETLTAAGMMAHELAKVLDASKLGHSVYVLHTRYSSVVTVGGFDTQDDPQLLQLQKRLAYCEFPGVPEPMSALPNGNAPTSPNTWLHLFRTPLPMEVPHF